MNRKQFLRAFWQRRIKPLFLISGLILAIIFIVNVFWENGGERTIVLLVLGVGIFILVLDLIGTLIQKSFSYLVSKLPPGIQRDIPILSKVIDYLATIIFGIIIYQMWVEDWISASILFGVLCIQNIIRIVQDQKESKSA